MTVMTFSLQAKRIKLHIKKKNTTPSFLDTVLHQFYVGGEGTVFSHHSAIDINTLYMLSVLKFDNTDLTCRLLCISPVST